MPCTTNTPSHTVLCKSLRTTESCWSRGAMATDQNRPCKIVVHFEVLLRASADNCQFSRSFFSLGLCHFPQDKATAKRHHADQQAVPYSFECPTVAALKQHRTLHAKLSIHLGPVFRVSDGEVRSTGSASVPAPFLNRFLPTRNSHSSDAHLRNRGFYLDLLIPLQQPQNQLPDHEHGRVIYCLLMVCIGAMCIIQHQT